MGSEDRGRGWSSHWGREALVIALGVFIAVLSNLFPGYRGWVLRAFVIVGVAVALALERSLERRGASPPRSVVPMPAPGVQHPQRLVVMGSLRGVEKAACSVFVDRGRHVGVGMLLGESVVVTAAHAVKGAERVTVAFFDQLSGSPVRVDRVELASDAARLDVALLFLEPGAATPEPPGLWPARRLPVDVVVLGLVAAEPVGSGSRVVWHAARLARRIGDGVLHLDRAEPVAVPGDFGAPVCDRDTGLLVGVAAGSEPRSADRIITVDELRSVGADLPRPWLMAGEVARVHFAQRARGQRSVTRGGDMFRGRIAAVAVVGDWMRAERCPGVPLIVTGQPGAGKSAVAARAMLEAERAGRFDGLGFHARGAAVGELVDALAAACGLDTPGSWKELSQDLVGLAPSRPLVVVVDGLDEAAGKDIAELRLILRDLARLDWFRVVVATRPLATGDVYRPGRHLHALGVTRGPASRNLVDLDTDRFHAPADLHAYAADQLTQTEFANPGPAGAAWESYRRDPDLCDRLAAVVAKRAGRNYLVAGMSAFQLSEDEAVVDPASPAFDPADVPGGVSEALTKHLDRLPQLRRRRVLELLTALAYGRGPGLDDQRWLSFARILGGDRVAQDDIDRLRESPAADYLIETTIEETAQVTRLFHQALADELLAQQARPGDERRLLAALHSESPTGSWLDVSRYARRHAPSHAAAAGTLEDLLVAADFLAAMHPDGMRRVLDGVTTKSRADPATIYDLALPLLSDDDRDQGRNAAVLEFVSYAQGNRNLAGRLAALTVERPWRARGKVRPLDTALTRFDGHTGPVCGVTTLDWPSVDHPVVVTTSLDGTARAWDPQRPDRELALFDGHSAACNGVATLDWPSVDHPVVVTTSGDGTARVWDPEQPDIEMARFDGHTGPVCGVTTLDWPGVDHPVVVTTSVDGTARVWDPQLPDVELACFDGHTSIVGAVASLAWPGLDHQVVVTTSYDGTARVWDPQRPDVELARFDGHTYWLGGVATLAWPGLDHPVIVTASADRTARAWDPYHPDTELARFDGHTDWVVGVASLAWPDLDHPVVVTTSVDGTAQVWDPHRPDTELARFDGHTGAGLGAVSLPWPGLDHPVVVTTSFDGTARVWSPRRPDSKLAPFDGHTAQAWSVKNLAWPGLDHPAVVTTSDDGTARVWDPQRPDVELARFDRHTARVGGVDSLAWPGLDHPVVVTASNDGTARVWDPQKPSRELACFDGHTGEVWGATVLSGPGVDHPVVVTTSDDGTARVWDPQEPDVELARFDGHANWVRGARSLAWPGLHHPVVATASDDGTVRVWDPKRPDEELARFNALTGSVFDVDSLQWPGIDHPVVISTHDDGTVRVWDPQHPGTELATLPAFGTAHGITVLGPGHLAVATSRGFVVLQIAPPLDP